VDWVARSCELEFADSPSALAPFLLVFREVIALTVPFDAPWGRSASVLEVTMTSNQHEIRMQSGDVIAITAAICEVEELTE
jgi:hypothetical protein